MDVDIGEGVHCMCVIATTYTYKRGLQLALVLRNIIDAFCYPLTKSVAVATHFVTRYQNALQS